MSKLQKLLQKHQNLSSPYRKIITDHHIPLSVVSDYIGVSYCYASQLLKGTRPITDKIRPKLDALVAELEAEGGLDEPPRA